MKTERTRNSIYNGLSNLSINISIAILSFIVRTIFIYKLGKQCLGLDGLFTNILSMLSLAELGLAPAVSFSLYKPLAEKNIEKINKLLNFFRKMYKLVSLFILIFGLLLFPFIKYLAKDYTVDYNIYLIFFLYLINSASSFWISYNNIIIEADQKSYKLTAIKLIFNLIVYGLQIVVLLLTSNFILYLVIQFIFRFIERIIIHFYIKQQYDYINFNSNLKLEKKDKDSIISTIKSLMWHRIGTFSVNSTDNIIISSVINISVTGVYSNYLAIVSLLRNTINALISGTTATFGNLNAMEDSKTKENSFDLINFVCFSIAGLVFVCLYFCFNPFVKLWVGEKYLLSNFCVLLICINFYLNCLLISIDIVKTATGLYKIDRFVPIIQAILNLIISIIGGIKFGISGVLIGTTISSLFTVNIIKPYVIYKNVFESSSIKYFVKIIKNILTIITTIIINMILFKFLNIHDNLLLFITYAFFNIFVYCIIFILINFKTKEFNYFKKIFIRS